MRPRRRHIDEPVDHRHFWGNAASQGIEEAVIGQLLLSPHLATNVSDTLTDEHFFYPLLARVYRLCAKHAAAGRQISLGLIGRTLKHDPDYQDAGGADYLSDVIDHHAVLHGETVGGEILEARAAMVQDLYLRREVLLACRDVQGYAKTVEDASGAELMERLESRILEARVGTGQRQACTIADALDAVVEDMRADVTADPRRALLTTGLTPLDEVTGGSEGGELILIVGRPGMGKSALGGCIALNMAFAGLGVVEINGEMTEAQMTRRHVSDWLHRTYDMQAPTYSAIRRRKLTEMQMRMVEECKDAFADLPLSMLKRTGLTLAGIRSLLKRERARLAKQGIPLRAAFIDHVGLVRPDGRSRGRYEDQTEVSQGLKEIADELGIVIFAMAQLNREVEKRDDKRPQIADIRETGAFEQDADVIIAVYREAYYAFKEKRPTKEMDRLDWELRRADPNIEAILLKIREGDPQTVKLWANVARNAIRADAPISGVDFDLEAAL